MTRSPSLSSCGLLLACMVMVTGAHSDEDIVSLMQQNIDTVKRRGLPGGLIVPLEVRRTQAPWEEAESIFYTANVSVGYPPQRLSVLIDTSSGFVVLPHKKCLKNGCRNRRKYSSLQSSSAEDVFSNGTRRNFSQSLAAGRHPSIKIDYSVAALGNGVVRGAFIRDRVCVFDSKEQKVCAKPVTVSALKMERTPFDYLPGDGILGLSLSGLSLASNKNFLDSLVVNQPNLRSQFGLSFGKNGGELHIGGYDPSIVANPLLWFPVDRPAEGQWQVRVLSVKIGGEVIDSCDGGCRAVVDTGTSRVGVQEPIRKSLHDTIVAMTSKDTTGTLGCSVPAMSFDIGGMELVLDALDIADEKCEPELGLLDLEDGNEPAPVGLYTLGASVLQKYFVAFDWKDNMIGFASTTGAAREVGNLEAGEQTFV